jgi:hypothetical protein
VKFEVERQCDDLAFSIRDEFVKLEPSRRAVAIAVGR